MTKDEYIESLEKALAEVQEVARKFADIAERAIEGQAKAIDRIRVLEERLDEYDKLASQMLEDMKARQLCI